MSTQIFKKSIPNDELFKFLDKISFKNEKHYTINNDAYKKGLFKEIIPDFLNFCIPYYHLSKRKYLEKKLTYNSFVTVLRQICNFNKIQYTSKILYDKSTYGIVYYIYY
jgi:hypothetical protein